jgi:superfamily II DNA/RNA helicase
MNALTPAQELILNKLGIAELNPMQKEALTTIAKRKEVVLRSPTGTGKTLAFLLPLLNILDKDLQEVQVMILAPSRELAIQIEQVTRNMGSGFKANAIYGGRATAKDKEDLKHPPAILIGTPGRIADHLRRETFSTKYLTTLILDEFDKCLEVGFELEMKEILDYLPNLDRKILTSATQELELPDFVDMPDAYEIDYLHLASKSLTLKTVISPDKDKLPTLVKLLCNIGNEPTIVFCNFKESIDRVSIYLEEQGIAHGCFFGGLEQHDRERALIKFRNGTYQLLIATDLAARGLDVPEIKHIVHYHLPLKSEEFTHRNGRTARMHSEGSAYVLKWTKEDLPSFIEKSDVLVLEDKPVPSQANWVTVFVSGGRQDKISKGDIAGMFFKQGQLSKDHLGQIEMKQDCAFVAVHSSKVNQLMQLVDNTKLKTKKVRLKII